MISGELDFDDRMYNDDTRAYYRVGYLIYMLFLLIMTIFVTNLLIGNTDFPCLTSVIIFLSS